MPLLSTRAYGRKCRMKLTPQEKMFLNNLQTQEEMCIEKYRFYSGQAKDEDLKDLFTRIGKNEKKHRDAIEQLLQGKIPSVSSQDTAADTYESQGNYVSGGKAADKKHDAFLCTDSITTEKYVASAYNNDLFHFASPELRSVLNSIQTEEQNHAELIYKYKTANEMC